MKSSGIVCSNQNCDIECYKTVVFTERKRRDYSKNKRYCYKKINIYWLFYKINTKYIQKEVIYIIQY